MEAIPATTDTSNRDKTIRTWYGIKPRSLSRACYGPLYVNWVGLAWALGQMYEGVFDPDRQITAEELTSLICVRPVSWARYLLQKPSRDVTKHRGSEQLESFQLRETGEWREGLRCVEFRPVYLSSYPWLPFPS